ncbi:uncharacterized protein LOC130985447 [Salvia miltiorrhiza]|uniref:uncharacterized protein LOC130985447 n=1 Tax=Salvia miltiorrhiza TaxID=226208 RepID=UPI0025AB69BA|nr:uncharacterized protein LOC130985447 [Salvia miltiorrhiza]
MAFAPALSLLIPFSPTSSFPFKPSPKLLFCPPKFLNSVLSAASSSNSQPLPPFTSEEAFLDAIAGFGDTEKFLPVVRTYENDLARLTLVGAVDSRQAITAAAADGGSTADEHISSGVTAMVVETIYPGPADDRSTVSTRLFLPTLKVKEKAIQLRKSMAKDMFQGISSKNILSMTFRQAVLEQLWSLELALFKPGTERNMSDLESPREVPVLLALSSSDELVISEIGEVVCAAALENTEKHFLSSSANRASKRLSSWLKKRQHITSKNSSVVLYNLVENELLANAKTLHEKFNSERGKYKLKDSQLKKSWLTSPAFSKLEKIGGPEFVAWISECVPSYMFEIDSNRLDNVKFEGWKTLEENRLAVVLTHAQMVSLVDILDMFYEDTFTLPEKRLPCPTVAKSSKLDLNKGSPLLKTLSTVLVSGIFFVTISVLGKLCLPKLLPIRESFIQQNSQAPLYDTVRVPDHSLEPSELETCCVSIIRRIKDSFCWPGEIRTPSGACACIGELPKFMSEGGYTNFSMSDMSSTSMPLQASEEEMKRLEDIASYQVIVSTDGKIIGFQPTNRVAVNNWAANPLAKELYGGKKLSPGLLEPGLKICNPSGMVVLELLISLNPKSNFALVRAIDTSGNIDG